MFGLGKKEADAGAIYSSLIQITCGYLEKFNAMPSEQTLLSDVPKFLGHYGAKIKSEHMPSFKMAAFLISTGLDGLDDDFKKTGGLSRLKDADAEKIAKKLQSHGVYFL